MAYEWARWLHHPCRLGCPPLQSGGQNPRWPTSGQGGYITPPAWGVPTASQREAESNVVHKWARWLQNPAAWGVPAASERGAESQVAYMWARWLHHPCHLGCPPLQSGGQNPRWPTSGQGGYITPPAWGVPTASQREAESDVVHKWARWLQNPCRLGGPCDFTAGGRITSGLHVGKVATSRLPRGGSPPLHSEEQNHRWPTRGQGGYITPAAWEIPTTLERGAKLEVAHKRARWLPNPYRLGRPHRFTAAWEIRERGAKLEVAHKRARCRITGGPQEGKVAT